MGAAARPDIEPEGARPCRWAKRAAHRILAAVLVYLAATWALFLLVDVGNVLELRDALARTRLSPPVLWWHLFEEGHLTELLQWLCLASFAGVSAGIAGRAATLGQRPVARFWMLMAAMGALMLIEDAGNPRHTLADVVQMLTGSLTAVIPMHMIVFSLIAGVGLYGVFIYAAVPRRSARSWRFLLGGVAGYGLAGSLSLFGYAGLYVPLGGFLRSTILRDRLIGFVPPGHVAHPDLLSMLLMDRIVEESIELVAASLLLAAALTYSGHHRNEPAVGDVTDGLWTRSSLIRR